MPQVEETPKDEPQQTQQRSQSQRMSQLGAGSAGRGGGHGVGVDIFGGQVVDPTANVIALTESERNRQDDLRWSNDRRVDAELRHVKEMANLRETYGKDLASAESKRLDSIRQVDVLAVNTAADRAQTAIQALATVSATNAETLRNALTTTASTIAAQLATTVAGINERISALERSSYEGTGKRAVTDPQIEALVNQVRALSESRATSSGKSAGLSSSATMLIAGISLIATLLGIGGAVIAFSRPAAAPQVIYQSPAVAR